MFCYNYIKVVEGKMKVILSKKGLDSTYGGYAIDLDRMLDKTHNKMLYIPMPMLDNKDDKGRKYKDIQSNYCNGSTFLELYKKFANDKAKIKVRGKTYDIDDKNIFCHPDPYILELYKNETLSGFDKNKEFNIHSINQGVSSFGQAGKAAPHLNGQSVGEGDLFLFYSSYKRNNKYIHAIWGYLEVGKVIECSELSDDDKNFWLNQLGDQPHKSVIATPCDDVIYVAKRGNLSFNPKFPSNGLFTFSEKLILTDENENSRTFWRVPDLSGVTPSWNGGKSFSTSATKKGKLRVSCCGQEFVMNDKRAEKWVKSLFNDKNFQNV